MLVMPSLYTSMLFRYAKIIVGGIQEQDQKIAATDASWKFLWLRIVMFNFAEKNYYLPLYTSLRSAHCYALKFSW
jgi:hypothetical protein